MSDQPISQPLSGIPLSFAALFRKNLAIEVPIIQRDYAQGRSSKQAEEIRHSFVDALHAKLCYNRPAYPLDLDFVYGSVREGKDLNRFIPLDGQQRLTTLFLLHWYLANQENEMEAFKSLLSHGKHSRFRYQTRTSSGEFCDALVAHCGEFAPGMNVSRVIENLPWFMASWKLDPTIRAMLTMLDHLHQKFEANTGNLYQQLTDSEAPAITFQFLNLESFKLTDDLYIKMNARGKMLTEFENFKARFETIIEQANDLPDYQLIVGEFKHPASAHKYFSHKIDTGWSNIFWKARNAEISYDTGIMNFIRVMATGHYASLGQSRTVDGDIKRTLASFVGKENPNGQEKGQPLTFRSYEELEELSRFIKGLIAIFDALESESHKAAKLLDTTPYFKEQELFKLVIQNNLPYTDRIRVYALYQFLTRYDATDGLIRWVRVIYNLTENTYYNDYKEFIRDMAAVRQLLDHAPMIEAYLSNQQPVDGFNRQQVTEERIKALLIQKNATWKSLILNCEAHGYFKGQIGFLLTFSGIWEFYESHSMALDWSEEENDSYLSQMQVYFSKANSIFDENGLRSTIPNFLWERALLAKGDYLLKSGSNYSFLTNKDRDISWKRLLRGADDGNEYFASRQNLVKTLWDDPLFDTGKVVESLEAIRVKELAAISITDDWRYYFIQYPETIGACEQRFCRWGDNKNILLLSGKNTNGWHREYYSFALCLALEKMGQAVEYNPAASVDSFKYIQKLNGVKLSIAFRWREDDGKWMYRFYDKENHSINDNTDPTAAFETQEEIIAYLRGNNYLISA